MIVPPSQRADGYNGAAMNYQIPRLYKLVLAIAIVVGPFYWLVFTMDGQRRVDLALLHLFGHPSFNVNLAQLTPAVTEADLQAQFPTVGFACFDQASPLGERVCAARIGAFNRIPARRAQAFFADERLAALRLDYRAQYHRELLERLFAAHGAARPASIGRPPGAADATGADADGPDPDPEQVQVLGWTLPGGLLALPRMPKTSADAALLWLAPGAVVAR